MSDFLWGVAAIGEVIGRTRAQTYHMLYAGKLKSPRKIGDQWVVSRTALMRELGGLSIELEDDDGKTPPREWTAKALRELAMQLGVMNDFYYPLIGAAEMLSENPSSTNETNI